MKKELLEAPKVKVHKPTKVTMTPLELKMKKEIARLEKIDKERADKLKVIHKKIEKLINKRWKLEKIKSKTKKLDLKRVDKELDVARDEYHSVPENINPKLAIAIEYIKKNCSEFLNVFKNQNKFLYRSVDSNHTGKQPFIANSPTNRMPVDASKESQMQIDNILKKSKFKALRSNSIFVTSDKKMAEQFGNTMFFIFPINGFSFTWNIKYDDLIEFDGNSKLDDYANYVWEKFYDLIEKYQENLRYKLDKLEDKEIKIPKTSQLYLSNKAFENQDYYSFNEVKTDLLPYCKKIKAIDLYNFLNNKIVKKMEALINKPAEDWGFSNSNLEKAINSGHEIYIHGKYVAIPEYLTAKLDDHEFRNLLFRK